MFGAAAGGYTEELQAFESQAALVEFLATLDLFETQFPQTTNVAFAQALVAQMASSATADGTAFAVDWIAGQLANGATRAEVIDAAITALLATESADFADAKADFIANVDGAVAFSAANADVTDVAELQAGVAATTADLALTAALNELAAAQEARDDFLAALDLDDDAATDTTTDDVEDQIDDLVPTGAVGAFNLAYGTGLAATSTAAQKTAAFAEARAASDSDIADQQALVDAAQTAVDALDAADEIAAYEAAVAADEAAGAALTTATAGLAGAEAAFLSAAGLNNDLLTIGVDGTATYDDDTTDVNAAIDLIVLDGTTLVLADGIEEADYEGVTALLAASTAKEAADANKTATAAAVVTAASDLDDVDGDANGTELGSVNTLATETGTLETLVEAAADLETAIADVTEAYTLNTDLEALTEAITDATTAITGAVADGGLAKSLLTNSVDGATINGTQGEDVFVVTQGVATTWGVAGNTLFETDGSDSIYFGETEYTLVAMADGETTADALGDAAVLEIFWEITAAGNMALYVEEETFGGSANGTGDLTTITLTGVTSADGASLSNNYFTIDAA